MVDINPATNPAFESFINPPISTRTIPKWVWNRPFDEIDEKEIKEQLKNFRDKDGYRGLMITMIQRLDGYMEPAHLNKYRAALDAASELGLKMVMWNENGFPSGRAGGLVEDNCPQHLAKHLDKLETDVTGPARIEQELPTAMLMGVVAFNPQTCERIDLSKFVKDGHLRVDLTAGKWKVMTFYCMQDARADINFGRGHFIDYLDREAVEAFIRFTHENYYKHFPEHFGSTLIYEFYDESSFWFFEGGRIWTPSFNKKFEEKYGYSPVSLYPALWYDIGPDTAAARNALFGLRAELYSENYIGTLARWDEEHGIELTGHQDQEEIISPVSISGDLMKAFKHQHAPGCDEIAFRGRGSRGYKVVSSAACNFDRPVVMCEAYGAMGEQMPIDTLYREAMDLYAKGINFIVDHGTWYDNNAAKVIFPPELSYRSKKFAPEMLPFHNYCGRLTLMLQGGRHIADIGVLYPIAALQAAYRFGDEDPYLGGVIAPEADYMSVGEMLSLKLRKDFTYIHPEVLDEKCAVRDGCLNLENKVNRESYKVFIVPGSRVVYLSNLEKIKEFYDGGGCVIFSGALPEKSAEFAGDEKVVAIIREMIGIDPVEGCHCYTVSKGKNGGKAICLGTATVENLGKALDEALPVYDVAIRFLEPSPMHWIDDLPCGNISYIHKVKDDLDVCFIANSSDVGARLLVTLRGSLEPEVWNPHVGSRMPAKYKHDKKGNTPITEVEVMLDPVSSLLLVSKAQKI